MLRVLLMTVLFLAGAGLRADDDFQPGDALYAPEEETSTAAAAGPRLNASYYSTAKITVLDLGRDGAGLEGAELFIDGRFVGKSPLDLSGFLISKPAVALSARLAGYDEALRPALRIPPEGEVRVVMAGDNAASWYTTPSWIAGLLMLGGAVAAYWH
jgi:hypothetical protein